MKWWINETNSDVCDASPELTKECQVENYVEIPLNFSLDLTTTIWKTIIDEFSLSFSIVQYTSSLNEEKNLDELQGNSLLENLYID